MEVPQIVLQNQKDKVIKSLLEDYNFCVYYHKNIVCDISKLDYYHFFEWEEQARSHLKEYKKKIMAFLNKFEYKKYKQIIRKYFKYMFKEQYIFFENDIIDFVVDEYYSKTLIFTIKEQIQYRIKKMKPEIPIIDINLNWEL